MIINNNSFDTQTKLYILNEPDIFYKIKKKIFNMFGFCPKFGADLAVAATA